MRTTKRSAWCLLWSVPLALVVACGPMDPYTEESIGRHEQPTTCGTTIDWQDVELYDGTLGVSRGFVALHRRRAGQQVRGTSTRCSGTLISSDLYLAAGHCAFRDTDQVRFGYQVNGASPPSVRPPRTFDVAEVVEQENSGSYDYSIVRLEGHPGYRYGWARSMARAPASGDLYTLIQHPHGQPQKVSTGSFHASPSTEGANWFSYRADTANKSSGTGVVDQRGFLIAVHTNGGCTASGGGNQGLRLDRLVAHSAALDGVINGDVPLAGDMDGDGDDDLVIFRPATGRWFAKRRGGTIIFRNMRLGTSGDIPLVGDVDGDGDDEMVVWRPSTGRWYARRRDGVLIVNGVQWGAPSDVPMLGDIDGDGDEDLVAWRPTNGRWFAKRRDNTILFRNVHWGAAGDIPFVGDLDRDGAVELIIYRPTLGRWFTAHSDGTMISRHVGGGSAGDVPLVGDVDGDGDDDLINWHPATGRWYPRYLNGSPLSPSVQWGAPRDMPLLGDFDGDGEMDYGIWRPGGATWFAKRRDGSVIFRDVRWGAAR